MPRLSTARESFERFAFREPRNPQLFLIYVFLFALGLRLSVMFVTSSYRIVDYGDDHFGFGWEMGRVARSIVEGHGFASPLPLPTGPTAMVGPVYPLILAVIFKVFGVYSDASGIAVRILQSVFSSLTCLFIYLGGRETLGTASAKLAAVAWALFPLNIFFTVTKVWETSLTGLLSAALFWYMLPLRHTVSTSRWAVTGALLGVAALLNTSLVMLVLPFGLSALWNNRARAILPATVGALTCLAVVSPWLVRNHTEFGKFILRSNFPLEFRVGNNEWSYGQKIEGLHPSNTPALNQHWQDVGEARFMAEDREANKRFLAAHPGRFVSATLCRILNYWTAAWIVPTADSPNQWAVIVCISILSLLGLLGLGKMFSSGNAAAIVYAGCLFLYPVVYYVTTTQPRFYHAITPLVILLGAFFVVNRKEPVTPETQPVPGVLAGMPKGNGEKVPDRLARLLCSMSRRYERRCMS